MAYSATTTAYIADVKRRGGVFIPALPGSTSLGPYAKGAPGARFLPSGAARWTYEIAPVAVRVELGWDASADAALAAWGRFEDATTRDLTPDVEAFFQRVGEKTGLDHGAIGAAAKLLGVPWPVLAALLLFVGYAMLRQLHLVPSLRSVVK